MISTLGHSGHSADVNMGLLVNGTTLPIAQMGPDFLLVRKPIDLPPGEATIVLRVDENERRWQVRLPDGLSAVSEWVSIAKA
jgi:hypothetical protein